MTQEYVIQRKGAVISEGENSFVPEKGLRAAEYRLIGNTPDAQASAILLCESRNPSQWAGIIGRIYALRGWKESFNISWMIDVVCTQSYADNKIFNVSNSSYEFHEQYAAQVEEYSGTQLPPNSNEFAQGMGIISITQVF